MASSRGQNIHPSGHAAAHAAGHPPLRKPPALPCAGLPSSLSHVRAMRGAPTRRGQDAGEKLRGALVPAKGGPSHPLHCLGPTAGLSGRERRLRGGGVLLHARAADGPRVDGGCLPGGRGTRPRSPRPRPGLPRPTQPWRHCWRKTMRGRPGRSTRANPRRRAIKRRRARRRAEGSIKLRTSEFRVQSLLEPGQGLDCLLHYNPQIVTSDSSTGAAYGFTPSALGSL